MLKLPVLVEIDYHHSSQQPRKCRLQFTKAWKLADAISSVIPPPSSLESIMILAVERLSQSHFLVFEMFIKIQPT